MHFGGEKGGAGKRQRPTCPTEKWIANFEGAKWLWYVHQVLISSWCEIAEQGQFFCPVKLVHFGEGMICYDLSFAKFIQANACIFSGKSDSSSKGILIWVPKWWGKYMYWYMVGHIMIVDFCTCYELVCWLCSPAFMESCICSIWLFSVDALGFLSSGFVGFLIPLLGAMLMEHPRTMQLCSPKVWES